MESQLKKQIQQDMISAMRAKDKEQLSTIRMLLAAIKQYEIDNKEILDDNGIIRIVEKLIKQRRESVKQFEKGNRPELAEKENREIEFLQGYLPEALTEQEVDKIITQTIQNTQATSIKDMGKVMGALKQSLQGRADMSAVSTKVRAQLIQ